MTGDFCTPTRKVTGSEKKLSARESTYIISGGPEKKTAVEGDEKRS